MSIKLELKCDSITLLTSKCALQKSYLEQKLEESQEHLLEAKTSHAEAMGTFERQVSTAVENLIISNNKFQQFLTQRNVWWYVFTEYFSQLVLDR